MVTRFSKLIKYNRFSVQLYLNNNCKIKLAADANNFSKTLKLNGDYTDANTYFARKEVIKSDIHDERKVIYGLKEEDFLKFVDSVDNELQNIFERVTSLPKKYRELENNSIDNYVQNLINDYPYYHPRVIKDSTYVTSVYFNQHIIDNKFDNVKDYFYSDDYFNSSFTEVMRKSSELLRNGHALNQRFAELDFISSVKNDTIRENLLYRFAEMGLSVLKSNKKEFFEKYLKLSNDDNYKEKIGEVYKSATRLYPGNYSPNFENYLNYNGGSTSLDDLKGKYVYIDIWATWCGPCMIQIPYLKEFESKYENCNIEFVSISIDNVSDYNKWNKMIAEKEMKGIQLLSDNDFNSQFILDYQVQNQGIPYFILLDPKSKIIMAPAPRPSQKEELANLFDGLNL